VPDGELAFDLAAETFAVVAARADADDGSGPPVAWLYGIARNKLRESLRRGRVEDEARRALGLEPMQLDEHDIERVEERADAGGPDLDRALGDRAVAAALRPPVFGRGLILRSTARVVPLAGGVELRIYVQQGRSFAAAADPKACAKVKLRRVRELSVLSIAASCRSAAASAAGERSTAMRSRRCS
jgi:hypothetical protein